MDIVFTTLRLILGCIFLIAGFNKSSHPYHFANTIKAYQMLPFKWMISPFAFLIISTEFSLGLLLIVGWQIRATALMSTLLSVSFVLSTGMALRRKQDIECGCFGKNQSRKISLKTFVLDVGLLVASLIIFLSPESTNFLSIDSLSLFIQITVYRFVSQTLLPWLLIIIGTLLMVRLSRKLFEIISLLPFEEDKI